MRGYRPDRQCRESAPFCSYWRAWRSLRPAMTAALGRSPACVTGRYIRGRICQPYRPTALSQCATSNGQDPPPSAQKHTLPAAPPTTTHTPAPQHIPSIFSSHAQHTPTHDTPSPPATRPPSPPPPRCSRGLGFMSVSCDAHPANTPRPPRRLIASLGVLADIFSSYHSGLSLSVSCPGRPGGGSRGCPGRHDLSVLRPGLPVRRGLPCPARRRCVFRDFHIIVDPAPRGSQHHPAV